MTQLMTLKLVKQHTDTFVISNTKKVAIEINILVKFTNYTDKEGTVTNTPVFRK